MKITLRILLAGILTSLLAGAAMAGTPRIDTREARQHARIVQGRCSGQLTRAEFRRLRGGQRRIRRMEWRAGADGRFTARERWRIERAQDRQSRGIYRLKHNARRA